MDIVISGSRGIKDPVHVERAIDMSGWTVTHITHGGAGGVDQAAGLIAAKRKIPFEPVPAEWGNFSLPKVIRKVRYDGYEYNAAAGMVRNERMIVQLPTDGGLIAVWDGKSSGTANCIAHAIVHDRKVFIYVVGGAHYHVISTQYLKEFAKDVIDLGFKNAATKWRGNRYARH